MLASTSTRALRSATHLIRAQASLTPSQAFVARAFSVSAARTMSSTPYKVIHTTEAPGAVAPYSQAVVHNGIAYLSGCIPLTPDLKLLTGEIEEQTNQVFDNLFAVLKAAGSEPSHVLKCTVFIKDMANFDRINAVYEKRFAPYKPARSAVEVARLPKDVGVEIECIAAVKSA